MLRKLSSITTIVSGYSFRGAVPFDASGNCFAAQVKDIDEDGLIDHSCLTPIREDVIRTDAFLQKNDVLLATRGTDVGGLKVGLYTDEDKKVIATSSLYVLRVTDASILQEYLLYYLKSFYGQHALKSMMKGATVQTISKKDLASLDIPIPPKTRQQLIIDTMNNLIDQKRLHVKKIYLLQTLADNIMATQA